MLLALDDGRLVGGELGSDLEVRARRELAEATAHEGSLWEVMRVLEGLETGGGVGWRARFCDGSEVDF